MLTMTYGAIVPISFPFAAISFFVEYWVDKFKLLRRNCRPPIIGKNLVKTISQFIPLGVLLNCLFSGIFHYRYNEETLVATLIGFMVSFIILLTPWVRVLGIKPLFRKEKVLVSENSTYNIS